MSSGAPTKARARRRRRSRARRARASSGTGRVRRGTPRPRAHRGHHLGGSSALAVKRHVLVEKPVIWHGADAAEGTSWRARVDDLGRRFAEHGLVLAVNAQWPWTLPAFAALHGAPEETPRALEMGLAPASSGRAMLGDALPHPLSLALALRPDLERLTSCSFDLDGAARCEVHAELSGAYGTLSLLVELVGRGSAEPRGLVPWRTGSTSACASRTTRSSCAMAPGSWTSSIAPRPPRHSSPTSSAKERRPAGAGSAPRARRWTPRGDRRGVPGSGLSAL